MTANPLRLRFMDPTTGRFTTLDPFGGDMQHPLSLNKYLYTQGDPVNGYDPTGNDDEGFSIGGPAIGGVLAEGGNPLSRAIDAYGIFMRETYASLANNDDEHDFEVDGYDARIKWASGIWLPWPGNCGIWGQPGYNANGQVYVVSNWARTKIWLWGHDTCNTIYGSGVSPGSGDGGEMHASVNLPPGTYTINWGWRVEASAKAAPGGGSFTIKSIGNKDIVGSFNPTTPYKKQDMLYSVVTVTEGGWVEFATYVPVVNITGGGLQDSDPSTLTTIEGSFYIYSVHKTR
jgi:hypothetical protein